LGYQLNPISDEEIARQGGLVVVEVKPVVRDLKARKALWRNLIDQFVIDMTKDELSSIPDNKFPEVVKIRLMPNRISTLGDKYTFGTKVYSAQRFDVLLEKGAPFAEIAFYVHKLLPAERDKMKQGFKPGLLDRLSD
jgi:hypothetical protein